MKVRLRSVEVMLAMVLFAVIAAAFLDFIGQYALRELHPLQFFADSNTYHRIYEGDSEIFDGSLVGVASNYLGPLTVLELLGGNIYLVMLLNVAMFSASVISIARLLRVDPLMVTALLALQSR